MVLVGLAGHNVKAGPPIDDEAYDVLRSSSGPRGEVILEVSEP